MTFRITKPGFYRTRDGRKEEVFAVLPERAGAKFPVIGLEGKTWGEYGFRHEAQLTDKDLVAEWVEPVVWWVNVYEGIDPIGNPYKTFVSHYKTNEHAINCIGNHHVSTNALTYRDGKIVDVTDEVGA